VLALLLGLFVLAAYAFVARSSRVRTDAAVADALDDLVAQLGAERTAHTSTRAAAAEVLREMRFRAIAFVIYDNAGGVVAASVPPPRRADAGEPSEPPLDVTMLGRIAAGMRAPGMRAPGRRVASVGDSEGGYRAALDVIPEPDGVFIAAAAHSLHDEAETLAEAQLAMAIAVPVALLLAWVGGWLLARRSLAPLVQIREHAARIGAGNLGERVPIGLPHDEVGQLAAVINALLDRLESSFDQQRQFMADASHELRTPVAVVQNEASLALSRPNRSGGEYEESLRVVRAAARRIRRVVEDLFLLARADAGELPLRPLPLYLDELVLECVRELRSLADAREVTLVADAPNEVPYVADEELLHRLVLNLMDNAIKHSPPGSSVIVRLHAAAETIRLEVEDHGAGIPADIQPRVFERFVRADVARSHDGRTATSGAGLGLSIARWIAQAHRGTLELARSGPSGTLMVLSLPVQLA
jgi:signal transduction histidine kinase